MQHNSRMGYVEVVVPKITGLDPVPEGEDGAAQQRGVIALHDEQRKAYLAYLRKEAGSAMPGTSRIIATAALLILDSM